MENKSEITESIFNMFKTTRLRFTVNDMKYVNPSPDEERVFVSFNNGRTTEIDVSCDSGMGILRDILKALGEY